MQVIFEGVGHRFPSGPWLFRGLTKTLTPGEVYALVGPSGSGKSTLLSLIAGWVEPAEGEIRISGEGRTSWVFQNPHGTAHRSALDHVVLPLLSRGLTRSEAEGEALGILSTFTLADVAHQPFSSLSGGEAQRLMLARAVASEPALFLIDEPTAQLDLHTRQEVNATIARLANMKTIVVVATHDQETRDMCTSVLDLRHYQDLDERHAPSQSSTSALPNSPTRGLEGGA
ncbi:ATP-binding cassette domain-containing protein [Schaalia sp. ZJ1691]|uniref:ATP-binding cassette domain-containing protein n=1 Tax=Schaalia sp. ZJ1691 TaxID=2709404 RepID=UPI0013EACA98|nr:ATP-binding cassette domain-containing protein [Schaalia sp. ZJ1691]